MRRTEMAAVVRSVAAEAEERTAEGVRPRIGSGGDWVPPSSPEKTSRSLAFRTVLGGLVEAIEKGT
jgi:hypothetical protein